MAAYASIVDADTYFTTRLPSEEWDVASVGDKTKALATATRLIDQLNFKGVKADPGQENAFPRDEGTVVPQPIIDACFEVAYALLEGRNPEYDFENINVIGSGIGASRLTKDIDNVPLNVIHNIPSTIAWNYLRPYLNNSLTLRLERLS